MPFFSLILERQKGHLLVSSTNDKPSDCHFSQSVLLLDLINVEYSSKLSGIFDILLPNPKVFPKTPVGEYPLLFFPKSSINCRKPFINSCNSG